MERVDFKCNHCKEEIDIGQNEFYQLYEEGAHEVDCPFCEKQIYINSIVNYTFEVTDEDGDEIID